MNEEEHSDSYIHSAECWCSGYFCVVGLSIVIVVSAVRMNVWTWVHVLASKIHEHVMTQICALIQQNILLSLYFSALKEKSKFLLKTGILAQWEKNILHDTFRTQSEQRKWAHFVSLHFYTRDHQIKSLLFRFHHTNNEQWREGTCHRCGNRETLVLSSSNVTVKKEI